MAGQSRKWMILVATIWIQAFTGTNFDFSAYSSQLKSVMGISQVQLNYLATASDLGKVFGWSSGLALLYLPLPLVLFLAAAVGFLSYGLQWLLITSTISLPYLPKAPLRKDGVANDRAGTNAPGFLLAGGVQRRACTNSRHRAGWPELGVHLRRGRVGHGGAVRAQQRGPQPQHPHHQHPPRLPPLRPTRRPGLRRQRHLRIRGGVSALRRQDGVHGEGVLRADLPVVGGHLARRARLQRRAVLEDEEGVQPRRAEPTDGAYTRRKLHQRKLQRSVRVAIAQLGVIENDRDIDRIERIIVSRRKGACKNQSADDLQKS
ncbi:uncharacterized protein M6B38_146950 [Iris pallida]|uniref:Nodulin-like domain-containing protein n=1 Tax=Iris pallida TaxID=29817 RepID=A0AAX6F9X3_IRIPA|nr:uncharacterized protein M6B38_146950 [Iris pallida]